MNDNKLARDLVSIFEAISIIGPNQIRFLDEIFTVENDDQQVQEKGGGDLTPLMEFSDLVKRLSRLIYKNAYIRSREQGLFIADSGSELTEELELKRQQPVQSTALQFQKFNATADSWDHHWQVYHLAKDGRVFVQKGDRTRVARPGSFVSMNLPLNGLQLGTVLSLRNYAQVDQPIESFFHSFGSYMSDQFDEFEKLRFYFNLRAAFAEQFFAALSEKLNRYCVPFHFKALVDARHYTRADAAVLYSAKRYFQIIRSQLLTIAQNLPSAFIDVVPMFCKPIHRGIGIAEDVGDEESFGMHRCRLVAEGIVEAWARGQVDVQNRMESVQASFARNGLCLDRPYLNAGSVEFDLIDQASGF